MKCDIYEVTFNVSKTKKFSFYDLKCVFEEFDGGENKLRDFINTLIEGEHCRVRINSNQFISFFINRRKNQVWNSIRWDDVVLIEKEDDIIDFT